jgi:hypothetical protein
LKEVMLYVFILCIVKPGIEVVILENRRFVCINSAARDYKDDAKFTSLG